MTIRKGYINLAQGQIHYRFTTETPRNATPVLLLHQTASTSVMYEALMHELAGDYRLIAPDTPGYGESFTPAGKPTIGGYADAMVALLAALGVERCYVFGHHTGAAIAVHMIYTNPEMVEKVVLSGPPYLSDAQKAKLADGVKPLEIQPDGSHILDVWERIRTKQQDATLDLIHRETLLTLQAVDYHQTYYAVFAQDFAGQLAAITCPVLVMAGEHDTIRASLEPTHAAISHSVMKIVPGAGTYICDRQPQVVAGMLREFFGGPHE